jgi:hypothetical protein
MDKIKAARELLKIAKDLEAYEFPNQKELVKYLHEHPAARPSKHTVKRTPKKNRLPDQLRNPDKDRHEEYSKLEHKDLDKDKVKKIRKKLKNLKDRIKKVDDRNDKIKKNIKDEKPVEAPPVEEVTPKLNKSRYTRSKNKHIKSYSNYNFDADPDKKESPWKDMDWKKYTKFAKQATHIAHALLDEHDFDDEAMNDIRETRKNRFGAKSTLTPQEIKQKYMDNMNLKNFSSPEALKNAKERVSKMSPADFLIVFRSILAEEEDEEGVIQNMKNIKNNQQKFLSSPQWSGESAHKTW